MTLDSSLAAAARVAVVEGPLNIATAAQWRERLLAALPESGDFAVHLGAVESCDTFGLQLLLALEQSARQRGVTIEWLQAPACLTAHSALLGLSIFSDRLSDS